MSAEYFDVVHGILESDSVFLVSIESGDAAHDGIPALFHARNGWATIQSANSRWTKPIDIDKVGLNGVIRLVCSPEYSTSSKGDRRGLLGRRRRVC